MLTGCVDLECGPAPVEVITDKAGTYRPAYNPMLALGLSGKGCAAGAGRCRLWQPGLQRLMGECAR